MVKEEIEIGKKKLFCMRINWKLISGMDLVIKERKWEWNDLFKLSC